MVKRIKAAHIMILLVTVLFAGVSILSFTSMTRMRGNARVVNYVGIVRGATQRLVKRELMGNPSDELVDRLDSIVNELLTGEGPNNLIVLQNAEYLNNMKNVQRHWAELKELILDVRAGGDTAALFQSSEEYFELADKTVSSAERFSEEQITRSITILVVLNTVVFIIITIGFIYFIRAARLGRRAEALGRIAYIDPLTEIPNRTSFERELSRLKNEPPAADLAVLVFDINDMKAANEELGHEGGDRIIRAFAGVLKDEAGETGFVCRYGDDEFLAIFENATEGKALGYLARIGEKLTRYNIQHEHPSEKISFAAGYVVQNMSNTTLEAMIAAADEHMYTRKRRMKGN